MKRSMYIISAAVIFVSSKVCSIVAEVQEGNPLDANSHVFMESIPQIGSRNDIQKINRMASDFVHEVTFVIRQSNISVLTAFLNDVSDPSSANYGRHMTKQEVADMTSNHEARGAVVSHLTRSGATIVAETLHGEYVTAKASISVWEEMFNTQFFMFHQFESKELMKKVVRAESYSIPSSLQLHIAGVFNTVQMPSQSLGSATIRFRDKAISEAINLAATGQMTPAKIRKFYNVGDTQGSTLSTQCIFATIEQHFSPSDLSLFQTDVGLPLQAVANVIGGHSSDTVCVANPDTCAEGNLDVQYIMATSPISPTTFWYTDDSWSTWLTSVANTPNPPLVFSISYVQEESYVTAAVKDAFNTEAIKLGAMGVTIVAASGDDGAISRSARQYGSEGCYYAPLFPASNPYVTAVGATSGPESGTEEVVCASDTNNVITSGGGFSKYYDQPSFQTAAVAGYFAAVKGTTNSPYAGYEASNRAYPDISLAGAKYGLYNGGNVIEQYGTSASAPVVAGFFSNINAARLAAGKGSLGWVNPLLYTDPSAFVNDITSGKNNCGAQNATGYYYCCNQGFAAVAGWDPTTGLGSLDYAKLAVALLDTKTMPSVQPVSVPSSPTQPSPQGPNQPPIQSPTQPSSQAPTRSLLQAPTRLLSQAPNQPSISSPNQPPIRSPNQPSISSPNQPPIRSPNQPSPLVPTQPSPQGPTQPSPLGPTQPSPQGPTQPFPLGPDQPSIRSPAQPSPQGPTQPSPLGPTQPSPLGPTQPSPLGPTQPSPQGPTQPFPLGPDQPSIRSPAQPSPPGPTEPSPLGPTQPSSQAPAAAASTTRSDASHTYFRCLPLTAAVVLLTASSMFFK